MHAGVITISDGNDNTPGNVNTTISENSSLHILAHTLRNQVTKLYISIFGAQIKYKSENPP